jgi:16S rRNA processing protein RimM
MGRIAAPFGVRGWVKVKPYSEDPDALMDHPVWLLGRGEQWREVRVEDCRGHGEYLVALLEGVADRDAAETLAGMEVALRRDALPEPEEDEYYWSDLVGLAAVNRDGVPLGRVDHLLDTGANDVLVVKDDGNGRERLIPFTAHTVDEVNLQDRIIRVDWHPDD